MSYISSFEGSNDQSKPSRYPTVKHQENDDDDGSDDRVESGQDMQRKHVQERQLVCRIYIYIYIRLHTKDTSWFFKMKNDSVLPANHRFYAN
jgi:hypothetical protein